MTGGSNMLSQERYKVILDIIEEREAATVSELAVLVGTSESSIRRDLTALARDRRICRRACQ